MQHRCDGGHATHQKGSLFLSRGFQIVPFISLPLTNAVPNADDDGTVTRLRDMPPSKKSLPALVCPSTLPNKVAIQRQLSRDH